MTFNQPPDREENSLPESPPPRKRHPLEEGPPPPPSRPPAPEQPRRQITLRIPIVQPSLTLALITINMLVFVLGFISPELGETLFARGASRAFEVLRGGEYYRLFTAMFLHAGLAHIFFNMYALYILGTQLEPVFGHLRFGLIYLFGGLAGSVLSVVMGLADLRGAAFSVGASGAVFAIFGAEMIYLYRHREIMGERGRAQFRSLLWLLGLNFMVGIATSFGGSRIRIDNWAHLGGLLGGLVLTWMIGPRYRVTQDPQNPDRFFADDVNPVENKYWFISVFLMGLVGLLAAASLLAR